MTRKHFKALAEEIKLINDYRARVDAAHAVCRACSQFNAAFDFKKFLQACNADV